MSIDLLTVEVRHERSLRLIFTNTLAGGAFGVPAPAFYAITSVDSAGRDPTISAAMVVAVNGQAVDLALGIDLVPDGIYQVSAIGVPAIDSTVTGGSSTTQFKWGKNFVSQNKEPLRDDRSRLLYGIDLLFDGGDYEETAAGDLARVSGPANVTKALYHAVETSGLPWDPTWGAGAREFVDSPSAASGTLRGSVSAQILRDPRVKKIAVDIQIGDAETLLLVTPTLVTNEPIEAVSIVVPNAA
jgi:hypothetical protein